MGRTSFYSEIGRNKKLSVLLVGVIMLVLFLLLYLISTIFHLGMAFMTVLLLFLSLFVVADALLSYYYGDRVVLKATGAKPADPKKHLYLINTVEGLAIAAGLPAPRVYVIPNSDINAFATGRDPKHASIAVTQGALDKLNRQELEGVLAHEMSHIGNYDIRFFTLIAVFVGLVAIISHILLRSFLWSGGRRDRDSGMLIVVGIVLAIVAPIVVRLVQLSISRKREFLADATGAKITRYPEGLASALEKILKYNQGRLNTSEAVSHLFISDPKHSFVDNLFATHPPLEERIRRLRSM